MSPNRRALRLLTAAALVSSGLGVTLVGGAAGPAAAAASLACDGTIYLVSNVSGAAKGQVRPVDITATVNAAGTATYDAAASTSATTVNQLGIGSDGAQAISITDSKLVTYDAATGALSASTPSVASGSGTIAGGVNPKNGLYYYGGYSGTTLNLYVYNPATGVASTGSVASVTAPGAPGTNGDIAFDSVGRMYFVASSATASALYRLSSTLPTAAPSQTFTATKVTDTTLTSTVNGIAFGSDGRLYLGWGAAMARVNPISGAVEGTIAFGANLTATDVASTDLASCASPSQVTAAVDLSGGRVGPTDQFTTTVTGGTYTTASVTPPPDRHHHRLGDGDADRNG